MTRVKIQIHAVRRLKDSASVHELAVEFVWTDDLPQHLTCMLTDPDDLGVNDSPLLIPHHRFAVLIQRENCAENGVMCKNSFKRCLELYRVHILPPESQAERVAGAGLCRRVQNRVIEISLIWNQMLFPDQLRLCQNIEILGALFREPGSDLPRSLPGVDVLVIHLQVFKLCCSQSCGKRIPAQIKKVVISTNALDLQHLLKDSADFFFLGRLGRSIS